MKRTLALLAGVFAATALSGAAVAQTPGETPYPAPQLRVFIAGQTVTEEGALTNFFIQGQTVVFRAYAGISKTKKFVKPANVRSFFVQIPGQPNVRLTYSPRPPAGTNSRYRWTGRWTVPADYPLGIVPFTMQIRTKSGQRASWTQIPVATSQLTITSSVDATFLQEAQAAARLAPDRLDVFLYVDTVNGGRTQGGVRPRPVGCTQTTTFRRGEQLVFRIWGTEASNGAILSAENVKYAYVKIPGQPFARLNWGPHGPTTNRVWFWTAAFFVPADFPLGTTSFRIVFKTESNKFGMYDHVVTIIP